MKTLSKVRWILALALAAIASAGAMTANASTTMWKYTSTPCSGSYCPGWAQWEAPDSEVGPVAVSDTGFVYMMNLSGPGFTTQVWRSSPTTPAWTLLGASTDLVEIDARGGVYQLHESGEVDMLNNSGGWKKIDKRSDVWTLAAGAGATEVYELVSNGQIWRYTGTAWQEIDDNPLGAEIVAGNNVVFQLHTDGSIWQFTGTPCVNSVCYGWEMLDNNAQSVEIAADSYNNLYQLHANGEIWKYTGTPCNGGICGGWQRLDDNPAAVYITAGGGKLYQMHANREIFEYTGVPCNGNSCTGWQLLDDNPATGMVQAGGDYLYQSHYY
jgi:hypothetical protein